MSDTPLPDGHLDLVVAAGGDGTVATAAGIAFGTSAPLAILPLGTANNIATSLGVNAPAPELVASWSTARRVPFDLGLRAAASKEWLVVEGVGGGLVPAGIARAQAELKEHGGRCHPRPRSLRPSAHSATRWSISNPAPGRCRWTDRQISDEFLLVEVLNIRSIGPNLVFAPDANPSDGYFDVITAQECHREELLTYLEHRADGRDTRLALPSSPRSRGCRSTVAWSCTSTTSTSIRASWERSRFASNRRRSRCWSEAARDQPSLIAACRPGRQGGASARSAAAARACPTW